MVFFSLNQATLKGKDRPGFRFRVGSEAVLRHSAAGNVILIGNAHTHTQRVREILI